MAEQNFSNSNRADPTSAAKIGKLLGVDAILVGSITEFGNETKKTNLGGSGGNWGGFGWAASATPTPRPTSASRPGHQRRYRRDSGRGRGQGPVQPLQHFAARRRRQLARLRRRQRRLRLQRLPEHHHRRSHQEGRRPADLGSGLRRPKVGVRTITVEGLVAAVDGGQIILNVGARAGVKVGDQLRLRVTKEIKDPATGAVIRRLTTTIGIVRPPTSTMLPPFASPYPASGFKTGDEYPAPASVVRCGCSAPRPPPHRSAPPGSTAGHGPDESPVAKVQPGPRE
jgi:hypothetical protein